MSIVEHQMSQVALMQKKMNSAILEMMNYALRGRDTFVDEGRQSDGHHALEGIDGVDQPQRAQQHTLSNSVLMHLRTQIDGVEDTPRLPTLVKH